ncbi:acyl carrier protein [Streptomyces sp. NPDC096136]|uniref:acyl carrier protein n=1 Tax=Streptomyces sp. NPDC096136 TaxID=3366076 RepID=UPI0038286632
MTTTLDAITQALTETFPIDAAEITPDKTFDELGLDSLALIEMSLIVQETTGITLSETALPQTVQELADLLDAADAAAVKTPATADSRA